MSISPSSMAGWCRPESVPPVTSDFHFSLLSLPYDVSFLPSLPPSWLDPLPSCPSCPSLLLFFLLHWFPATPGLCWPCSFHYFLHNFYSTSYYLFKIFLLSSPLLHSSSSSLLLVSFLPPTPLYTSFLLSTPLVLALVLSVCTCSASCPTSSSRPCWPSSSSFFFYDDT